MARQSVEDVTAAAGLDGYLHAGFLGDTRRPDFVETMGPGACWLDADEDGLLDLFLVNGRYYTEPEKEDALKPTSRLYRNTGSGFVDATAAAGVGIRAWGQGCAAADYDNDGDTDLYVAAHGTNHLFRNRGDGTFENVTAAAGVDGEACGPFACWSTSATWFDADLNGCLDLYVGNFGNWTFGATDSNPAAVPPQQNRLYLGSCGGAFVDVTFESGLEHAAHTWSSVAYDLDLDGWPDLYDSNDGDPNNVWMNNRDGTFRLIDSAADDPRAGMGTAIGDLNHDGRPDIVTTNFVQQDNGIYLGLPGGDYRDIGSQLPFRDARPYSGWATLIHDYDHDALADLVVVNGLNENVSASLPGFPTEEPLLLYRQLADRTFVQVNRTLGAPFQAHYVGRGAAWADYDEDGDVDMLLAQGGELPVHLLRTHRAPGNFLTLDLESLVAGVTRDAIGARVQVEAQGILPQVKEKTLQMGFMSTNDPRLHFGLGEAARVNLTVRWPDGATQSFADVPANAFLHLQQGATAPTVLKRLPIAWATGPAAVERLAAATFEAGLDAPVTSAVWEFGDGTWATCDAAGCVDSAGAVVGNITGGTVRLTHAFSRSGAYDVHVALTDEAGRMASRRLAGDVTALLVAELAFHRRAFGMAEKPVGTARVAYEDGSPVSGADVQVEVRYSFWSMPEDLVVPLLPRSVRELAGYRTVTIAGTTDSDGAFTFEVPLWWRSPVPAAPVAFNPMGDYWGTLTGSFGHSSIGPVHARYQVLPLR